MSIPSIQSTNGTTHEVSIPSSGTQETLPGVALAALQAAQNIQNSTINQSFVADFDLLPPAARHLAKTSQWIQMLGTEPNNVVALEGLGDICCLEDRPHMAKKYYEKAMSIDPYNGSVMAKLSDVYARLHATRMLKLLAKTYLEQGDYEGAKIQYRKILDIEHYNVDALNNLGLLLYDSEDYATAQLYYEQALAHAPNSPSILTDLGKAVCRQGNLEQSKTYFIQALNIMPSYWQASYHLGELYYRQHEPENAKKAFLQSMQSMRHAPKKRMIDILNFLGSICMQQQNPDQAKQYLEQVLNMNPNNLLALQNLAATLIRQDNFVQAERHLRNALDLDPYDWFTLSRLGYVLYRQGRLEQAKSFLEEAVPLAPSNHGILNTLGDVLLSMSNFAQDEATKRKYIMFAVSRFNQAQYERYENCML